MGQSYLTTLIIKQYCKLPGYNDVTVNIFMCILNNLCVRQKHNDNDFSWEV